MPSVSPALDRVAAGWDRGTFDALLVGPAGVERGRREGFVRNGLGLSPEGWNARRGRAARWDLTHLNSGCRLAEFAGPPTPVFRAATAASDIMDWDAFTLALGWQQVNPAMPGRLHAVLTAEAAARGRAYFGSEYFHKEKVEWTNAAIRTFVEMSDG